MRRFAKIISVVMAMTVAFSAMPMYAFAASCTTHTPNADVNGIIIPYVTDKEHYYICTECFEMYGKTAHTNDGNNVCSGCGATLDAGTDNHTHYKTSAFSYRDQFGHMWECGTGCTGVFETHRNMYGPNCDFCMWDGPIIGVGGGQGGNECQHTPRYNNDGVLEYGVDDNEHAFICDNCEQPYNFQPHTDADGNGKCDVCYFGECNHVPRYNNDGVLEYAVNDDDHYNICDICGDPYNQQPHTDADGSGKCDVCNFGECNHVPRYNNDGVLEYGVDDNEHAFICDNCEQPYNFQPHTDADGNGKCDVCYFGECNHVPRYNNDGVLEYAVNDDDHYNICDICGDPYNQQPHTDADGSGKCDVCNFGECNHTPRYNNDGVLEYCVDDNEHANICDNCGEPYNFQPHNDTDGNGKCDVCNFGECINHTPVLNNDNSFTYVPDTDKHYKVCHDCGNPFDGEAHINDDGDDRCDMCHIPVVADGNGWIHNHHPHPDGLFADSENHFNRCDTCGMTEFNVSVHRDMDTDGRCDICNVSVDAECRHHCQTTVTVAKSEEDHCKKCPECKTEREFERHEDNDSNGKCDECNATLDENDMHIHQPNGRWMMSDNTEHSCECTECDGMAFEQHCDNVDNGDKTANPDGLCDMCDFRVSERPGPCRHSNGHTWWDTTETVHALHCGDCGEQINPAVEHTDSNSDGRCDVCLAGVVNNIHTHVWATVYSFNNDNSEHFLDCTNGECTRSTEAGRHCDIDGDDKCDVCQTSRQQGSDWCTEHSPTGEIRVDADNHYNICSNCSNRCNGENHIPSDEWVCTSSRGHRHLCTVCWEPVGIEEKHTNTDEDTVCDQCGVEVNANDVHKHISNNDSIDNEHHFRKCDNCGCILQGTEEWHTDLDNDGKCDACKATVDDYNWHEHIEKPIKINNENHIVKCVDCGTEMYGEEHRDDNDDSICDGCHTAYIKIKVEFTPEAQRNLRTKLEMAIMNFLKYGDNKGFGAFFQDLSDGENLAGMYDEKRADSNSVYCDFIINSWVHIEEEQGDDPAVKVIYDNARKAVSGGKLSKLFTFDVLAAVIDDDGFTGWSCNNLYEEGKLSYTAKIDAADVKSDRAWYVYATEDGTTYKKVGESEKGADKVTFTAGSNDMIYALISSEGVSLKAPTNVKATNDIETGSPKISWNKVEGAAKYQVWRSTTGKAGSFTLLVTTTATSQINKNAVAGKLYYYKVVAVDANGNKSADSAIVQRTADLAKVTGVKATNDAATGKPKISWDKVDGATGYKVYRSTAQNGTYGLMGTYTGTTMTNKNAVAGKLYYYKVMAVHSNANANGVYSAVVQRTADLAQVTNLKITNDAATGKPKLTWNKVEGAVSYKVYRSTAKNGTYGLMGTYTGTTMTNKNAVAGKLYYYKVIAVHSNTNANSAYSAIVQRTADLARPTVTVKIGTTGKPVLSWNKVDGATKYKIYRSTAQNGTYTLINTVAGTTTTNKNAVKGKKYYYKVVAVHSNTNANSAYSNIVSITSK